MGLGSNQCTYCTCLCTLYNNSSSFQSVLPSILTMDAQLQFYRAGVYAG
uniref:Uncharacterized protein n=1 Tax=Anguilla anguilla TaxID=7936 RepID=A0A0E9UA45_ANGAN